jgi:hypothetical protein
MKGVKRNGGTVLLAGLKTIGGRTEARASYKLGPRGGRFLFGLQMGSG